MLSNPRLTYIFIQRRVLLLPQEALPEQPPGPGEVERTRAELLKDLGDGIRVQGILEKEGNDVNLAHINCPYYLLINWQV